jgi:hypothetical protein
MEGLDLYEGVVKHVLYRLSGILVIDQNHLGVDLLSSRQTRAKKEKAITENVIGCRIGKKNDQKTTTGSIPGDSSSWSFSTRLG